MKRGIPCRHCGSPARWNPCWYRITIAKGSDPSGGDPPCLGDIWDEEQHARKRKGRGWVIVIAVALLILAALAYSKARAEDLIEPTPEEYAEIQKWIPATCCWTGNCCKKVHATALIQLPDNRVRVVATGQELPRTGWSQDGQTWRCTCDFVPALSIWRSHPHAKTHCVFPVPQGY